MQTQKSRIANLAIALFAMVLLWSHLAEAQTKKIPRIGFLGGSSASAYSSFLEAFRQSLRDLGYEEGQNIAIDYRYGEEKRDRLPDLSRAWSVARLTSLLCRAH